MPTQIFPANERGFANHGWLQAAHSFSFASYYDPKKMGFETLRVLNDDRIGAGGGFGSHPHENMEIVTIPLEGALEHKDSMGNIGVIKKGEVQVMSAGTGVVHSEYNASATEPASTLQIWVETKTNGIDPYYDQKKFEFTQRGWTLLVSPDGRDQSLKINQDAYFSIGNFKENEKVEYKKNLGTNELFIFLIAGSITTEGTKLGRRDGLGVTGKQKIEIDVLEDSEILILEVPKKR